MGSEMVCQCGGKLYGIQDIPPLEQVMLEWPSEEQEWLRGHYALLASGVKFCGSCGRPYHYLESADDQRITIPHETF